MDKTVARILKVNHAGEYGAVRIYSAQLLVSRLFHKELVSFLEQTLAHEVEHCQKFIEAMKPRGARPCNAMPLWGIGGWFLGFITACMGSNAVMICTAAVEGAVHKHLEDQIIYLDSHDDELCALIRDIQQEEIAHLAYARANQKPSLLAKPLSTLIALSTDLVIWLSTQGDVSRMKNMLRASKVA